MSKLVDVKTGNEIHVGDVVQTFRGEKARVTAWTEPCHAASTGRVSVVVLKEKRFGEQHFFPSVVGAEIVK